MQPRNQRASGGPCDDVFGRHRAAAPALPPSRAGRRRTPFDRAAALPRKRSMHVFRMTARNHDRASARASGRTPERAQAAILNGIRWPSRNPW
jgi:hypothetical protein